MKSGRLVNVNQHLCDSDTFCSSMLKMRCLTLPTISIVMLFSLAFTNSSWADTWYEIKTDNFIIYTDGGKSKGMKLLKELEAFRFYLRQLSNVSNDRVTVPLTIYLIKKQKKFNRLISASNASGVYVNHLEGPHAIVLARTAQWKYSQNPQDIIFHEYVHFFMAQFNRARLPLWYNEGFAEFLSSFHEKKGKYLLGTPPMARIPTLMTTRSWASAEEIFLASKRRIKGKTTRKGGDLFYGQSWLLTHTLIMEPEFSAKSGLFKRELISGLNAVDAFEKTYELPISALDTKLKALKRSKSVKHLILTLEGFVMPPVAMKKIPKADGLATELQAAYHFNYKKDDKEWTAEELKEAIAKYPDHLKLLELYIFQTMSREDKKGVEKYFSPMSAEKQQRPEIKRIRVMAEMYQEILSHERGNDTVEHYKKLRSMVKPLLGELKKDRMNVFLRYLVSYGLSFGPKQRLNVSQNILVDTYNIYPQSFQINKLLVDVLLRQKREKSACKIIMPTYLTAKSRKWQSFVEQQFSVGEDEDFDCSNYEDTQSAP